MARVVLHQVSKRYEGGGEVVRDFNLKIRNGEFLVLVGPSGCGKSTTLRMIAGLEDTTEGDIYIDNRVVNHVPPKDRDIAMVFQNYALYPHMTVYDNMAFGLKLRKISRQEIHHRVEHTARILGLTEMLKRKPASLSGGQRQRVAMGRAIVRKPAVFLFDEPLSNLDAKMRIDMRKEILQLHKRVATTMIYVTHDQVEAMTLGDRICVMNNGVIEQVGPPSQVFNQPASLFVARFIGTPSINVFKGTLAADGNRLLFESECFTCILPAARAEALKPHAGKAVSMGIRPRSLRLLPTATEGPNVICGDIGITEVLGEEILLHMNCGEHEFVASAHARNALDENSTRAGFEIDVTHAHFFDEQSGQNLFPSGKTPGKMLPGSVV